MIFTRNLFHIFGLNFFKNFDSCLIDSCLIDSRLIDSYLIDSCVIDSIRALSKNVVKTLPPPRENVAHISLSCHPLFSLSCHPPVSLSCHLPFSLPCHPLFRYLAIRPSRFVYSAAPKVFAANKVFTQLKLPKLSTESPQTTHFWPPMVMRM